MHTIHLMGMAVSFNGHVMGTDNCQPSVNPQLEIPNENRTGLKTAVIWETTIIWNVNFILVCYNNTERNVIYHTAITKLFTSHILALEWSRQIYFLTSISA